MKRSLGGFTLIELIIVIMILGFLAVLISGNFFTSLKKGRDARRKADLEQIQRAVEMFYEDKKAYPTTAPAPGFPFGLPFSDSTSGKVYMQKVSNDPSTGKNYEYSSDSQGSYYKIYTCLENSEQIITNVAASYSSFNSSNCGTCKNALGSPILCVWGTSSPNTTP